MTGFLDSVHKPFLNQTTLDLKRKRECLSLRFACIMKFVIFQKCHNRICNIFFSKSFNRYNVLLLRAYYSQAYIHKVHVRQGQAPLNKATLYLAQTLNYSISKTITDKVNKLTQTYQPIANSNWYRNTGIGQSVIFKVNEEQLNFICSFSFIMI